MKDNRPIMMIVVLLAAIFIFLSSPSFADCSENVVVGDKVVKVVDPLKLLREARKHSAIRSNVSYVYLGCHPVLETIAKDNGMNCQEFLEYTGILQRFNDAFADLIPILPPGQVQQTYNLLLQQVVESVVDQLLTPRSAI